MLFRALYPFFEILPGVFIYAFGLSLSISFFVFLFLLQRNAKKFGYDFSFFTHNIVWFFLSIFFFSRLFYVIANWYDQRFIWENPIQFFIMSDFNFSLFGAIVGFFVVYYILTRVEKRDFERYIDGTVIAFFSILVIGFIGAFLGGQVYGRETHLGIEILYNKHNFTPVPFQVAIFPLPLVYAFLSFIIAIGLYILTLFVNIKGFVGYVGLLLFASMILIGENFSGKIDILSRFDYVNFPQLCALVLALWSGYKLYYIVKKSSERVSQTLVYGHE